MRVYPLHLLEGYKIKIRKDRDKYDGGLIEFVKNGFICKTIPEYTSDNIECICSEFTISKSKGICFSIYRAPVSSNLAIFFFEELPKFFSKAVLKYENIILHLSPSMKLNLSRWGGLSTKQFEPECVNEESSTERCS